MGKVIEKKLKYLVDFLKKKKSLKLYFFHGIGFNHKYISDFFKENYVCMCMWLCVHENSAGRG